MLRKLALVVLVITCLSSTHASQWTNWNGRQQCDPVKAFAPQSVEEVQKLVKKAWITGSHIKVHGSGHSFTGVALTDGLLLSLENLTDILKVEGTRVTVQAGIQLKNLNERLWVEHSLAMPNLGAIGEQTIAGATQTATHGTGRKLPAISSAIVGMKIVDGKGQIVTCSATENADLFSAARVGLGALGIVVEVTLQAVPAYYLERNTVSYGLDELIKELPGLNQKHERLQYFTDPRHPDRAGVITFSPIGKPEAANCTGTDLLQPGTYCVDRSYRALSGEVTEGTPVYTEIEMMVDVKDEAAVLSEYLDFLRVVRPDPLRNDGPRMYTGVRYVAGDSVLLSPFHRRDTTAVFSFLVWGGPEDDEAGRLFDLYAHGLEAIARRYGGRPHMGKMNWANHKYIRQVFPETFDAFESVRRQCDPADLFVNPYISKILGINERTGAARGDSSVII